MKRGALSLRHGTRQQRRKKTHLGARRHCRKRVLGGAMTLSQEGVWGARRQHRRKRLRGRDDATAGRVLRHGGNDAGNVSGARLGPSGHERTHEQDRSEGLWPRIGRESGVRMKKNPICCSFSPGSRNRVKASTALSRHYAEGPDGYTRRVLLKLQQIAIRCIRQGGTGAR